MHKTFRSYIFMLLSLFVFFWCSCNSEESPEIVIYNSVGQTIVNNTGIVDFGVCSVEDVTAKTFAITNISNEDLKLTGNPYVEITGADADQFIVSQQPDQMIAAGLRSLMTIQFKPTIVKRCNAVVSIKNNDKDNSSYTFAITGKSTKAYFDFNGDGYHDIIVGAKYDDDGSNRCGCAFIFFGNSIAPSLIDATKADVKFESELDGYVFGISVCNAGDVNNDGYDDAIIGAYDYAYIFFGCPNPASKIEATDADVKLVGEYSTAFGCGVSNAGDINGDGFDDVIVGAANENEGGLFAGSAFVFFGSNNLPSIIDSSNADIKLVGEDIQDAFSISVSCAGDVNSDGYDDIIVGSASAGLDGSGTGRAYVFYGSFILPTKIDASDADVILTGDQFGQIVSGAGDVNNDGFDDIIVGASGEDDSGEDSGCAFIFYGSSTLPSTINASNANVKLIGEHEYDLFGYSVCSVGDVNDDGIDDFIVGSDRNIGRVTDFGGAYVFFGSSNLSSQINASSANVKITGENHGDEFGYSVGCAGDINRDGFIDVIVGSPRYDDGGLDAGAAFVYFGKQTWASPIKASDADVKLIGEDAGDHFGCSIAGGK